MFIFTDDRRKAKENHSEILCSSVMLANTARLSQTWEQKS
jgi:hypothetical protein